MQIKAREEQQSNKMHASEVDIDVALVEKLIDAQFPQWADLSIEPVLSVATDNTLYKLGDSMVVRLPRIPKAAEHIEKEYKWLPRLAPLLPLAIPVPLAKGIPVEEYPFHWSVYKWLDGDSAAIEPISDLHQAAHGLGQFVNALHQIDTTGAPSCRRGFPLSSRDSETRKAIETLQDILDIKLATALWETSLNTSVWKTAPVWIHGDLHAANMLTQQGRLSAIIDFGSSGVGDPACDMMVAWTVLSAETRGIFRAAVQADNDTWARGRGWAFTFGIVALPYYRVSNPILATIAQRAIDEVLADYKLRG